jgi:hypothetical protein
MAGVQFGQGDFSLLREVQTGPGAHRASYVMGAVGCSYGSKAASPPGAEVTPPYIFMNGA